jgi:DNA-binding IclR family transcriptional regulator
VTDEQADVLRMLRVFGPCSNAEVARRLKVPSSQTYRTLAVLVRDGLAVHPKLQRWDLSERGRAWFSEQPNKPLSLFAEARP